VVALLLLSFSSFTGFSQAKYCVDEIKELKLPFLSGKVTTYYSLGQEKRATELKGLLERAARVFEDSLGVKIELTIAALDAKDWVGLMDRPYGLPTVRSGSCKRSKERFAEAKYAAILPGAVNGPIYDGWTMLKDSLLLTTIQSFQKAGVGFEQGGKILLDFVALHELGHAYAHAFGINYHVNFFAEFIADYLAYSFLRSTPERLDKKVLAVLSANVATIRPIHSSFNSYETFRSSDHPPTETWYNSIITLKAAEIYEQRGFEFVNAVKKSFTEAEGQLKTDPIIARLETIYPGILKWSEHISEQVRKPR
jgi:hypothetical protein